MIGNPARLMHENKTCVPEAMSNELIVQWHAAVMGHAGIKKMKLDLKRRFLIPSVDRRVRDVRVGCQVCQATDHVDRHKEGEWVPSPIPSRPGESIAMDIVSLPLAKGADGAMYDGALVIIDRLSGWIEAWPILKKGFTAKKLGCLVAERWMEVFGTPKEVVSDNGPHFTGSWWRTLCAKRGIVRATAIAYRPRSNGAAERAIQTLLDLLRRLHAEERQSWLELLPRALRMARCTPTLHGVSPFQAIFGRDWLQEGATLPVESGNEDAEDFH